MPPICACARARAAHACDTIDIASKYLQGVKAMDGWTNGRRRAVWALGEGNERGDEYPPREPPLPQRPITQFPAPSPPQAPLWPVSGGSHELAGSAFAPVHALGGAKLLRIVELGTRPRHADREALVSHFLHTQSRGEGGRGARCCAVQVLCRCCAGAVLCSPRKCRRACFKRRQGPGPILVACYTRKKEVPRNRRSS